MTIEAAIRHIRQSLEPQVGGAEARAMAYAIVEDIKGYTPAQIMMYAGRELLPETVERIDTVIRRILAGEPMQYATGKAHWRGRIFSVDSSVLIPRPETAQLTDMIVSANESRSDLRVLDVGTGSGCIAISLALDLPFSRVTAVDISAGALDTARKNASGLKAKVRFVQADAFALGSSLPGETFDIIVSNPPYVLDSELPAIDPRVALHEPRQALFVSDKAPIAIYEAIARYASTALSDSGRLYFEINPLCAPLISECISSLGFTDVDIIKDYKSNIRFVIARLAK